MKKLNFVPLSNSKVDVAFDFPYLLLLPHCDYIAEKSDWIKLAYYAKE